MQTHKKLVFGLIYATILVLSTLALTELSLHLLLDRPGMVKDTGILEVFRPFYTHKDRKIIQYRPECAHYNSELTYILRSGSCQVSNREFEVEYRINSAGLRDDEDSLLQPKIVFVGDSHAMGWGVAGNASFPQLVEKQLGKKVLNASISSYGTVRELKLLNQLDTSNMELLVIQYCDNDFRENNVFYQQDNTLPISTRIEYEEVRDRHLRDSAYRPGKYSVYFLSQIFSELIASSSSSNTASHKDNSIQEARRFINAIIHSPIDLSKVPILVIETNGHAQNDSFFIQALRSEASRLSMYAAVRNIQTLDVSNSLQKEHYFILDDHMNTQGHQRIAEILTNAISQIIN